MVDKERSKGEINKLRCFQIRIRRDTAEFYILYMALGLSFFGFQLSYVITMLMFIRERNNGL